ncbi:MAG: IPT/TIG domain-containing protein [Dysgonomonas sp.]|nr:IPT/TIG domain-containing protein [Dysgonomonas sp.]
MKNAVKGVFLISLILGIISCKDDKDGPPTYNPTVPVEVTSFFPEEGSSGSQLLIHGVNFGTDTTQVKVTVNDKRAVLISVSGTSIYCLVPPQAGNGTIKVEVGTGDQIQQGISQKEFEYIPNLVVKTLAGWVDRDGNSSIIDGSFEEAQFETPYWMVPDKDGDNIYLIEQERGLRVISLKERKVTTLFRTGNGMEKPRSMAFSPDYEKLYIFNDQDKDDGIGVVVAHRKDNFKTWEILARSGSCCGGDCNPVTGDLFFNRWNGGEYYKWNFETSVKDFIFRVDNGFNSALIFSEDGLAAYIVSMSQHCIYKLDYDMTEGKLGGLRIFCGKKSNHDQGGFADGPGSKARFNEPQQGTFDEDGNFYICDQSNHCIRKIEPNGQVTTFAGRPGEWGYTDGDLRKEARFDRPHGIAYNKKTKEFYIADRNNRRIRIITKE